MIVVRYEQGRNVPLIICDVCGDAIEDSHNGIARLGENGETPLYAHKGDCHDEAEARQRARGCDRGW